jgi:hypothetical protein
LVEQREFELPVLFVVHGAYGRLEVSAGHRAKADQRINLRAICWQIAAKSGATSDSLPRGKRPKRTGSSNPLCSTNESVRTAGPLWGPSPIALCVTAIANSRTGATQKQVPEVARLLCAFGHPEVLGMAIMEHLIERADYCGGKRDNLHHRRVPQQKAAHSVGQPQHIGASTDWVWGNGGVENITQASSTGNFRPIAPASILTWPSVR